ncbi:MAG: mechanosensitive ion channel family protein [Desulfobacteraceae bacterium]|jgi:small-conductance mechanosensitive channel
MQFLSRPFLGNMLQDWLNALGFSIGLVLLVYLLKMLLIRRFFRLDQESESNVYGLAASLVKRISFITVIFLSIYLGTLSVVLPAKFGIWLFALTVISIIYQSVIWGNALITYGLKRYQATLPNSQGERITTMRAIGFVGRLTLVSVATLVALDNIPGVRITTLIASLGIGGIAVAMAVQNILADLLASLSIVFDKPFVIGDFIIVDTHMGAVEYIGLKTTRLRSLSGEQLVFANNDLLQSRIRNYKRMAERRVVFLIGVLYQTEYEQLVKIPKIIREIIETRDNVRFDRSHFQGYGDSALNFETVYYILSADYNVYMDIQQAINLEIFRRFKEDNISFAYPTRTLYLQSKVQEAQNEKPV